MQNKNASAGLFSGNENEGDNKVLAEAHELEEATLAQAPASDPDGGSGDTANLSTLSGRKRSFCLAVAAAFP
jgi:hypothetical protein